ncbi:MULTISPECIES: hypothetical protein [Amycolatopsis]|uniref:Secreted protein n=1 Tax=Amycolatopsis tucumanensis TaxID=401106 RepID=A0ABP7IX35_9PSEU|nr:MULTISPECIES: hypothetical protein [Amycolatopsis]MCF6423381.1 hypothetical protein [Amycolatopsis tucumanensis]
MRARRSLFVALATSIGAVLALLVPGTAAASDYNIATASNGPSGNYWYYCVTDTGVEGCYQPYGDLFYVRDTKANGQAAEVRWYNNLNGAPYRQGTCRNNLGSGHWGVCDKDFREDSTIRFGVDGVGNDARLYSPTLYA